MRGNGRLIIGITGGIAAGKSTVMAILESFGFRAVDADKVAHSLYRRGTQGYDAVVTKFGAGILSDENSEIDRRKLGAVVFSDPSALQELEEIIYPLVNAEIEAVLDSSDQDAAVEAINLFSSGLNKRCDENWFVRVAPEIALSRLTDQRGMRISDAFARLSAQREIVASAERSADWTIQGASGLGAIRSEISARLERLRTEKATLSSTKSA